MNNVVRKRTNLTLDGELIERSKELSINLPKAAEERIATCQIQAVLNLYRFTNSMS